VTLRPVNALSPGRFRRRFPRAAGGPPAPDAADLYRRLAPTVLGYLRSQRLSDAEDVLGDIFLQVVRDLARFRGNDAALRRWVFTIAHHRIVDAHRRATRRPILGGENVQDRAAPTPPDPLDPELTQALGRLTADQREVVALRFVADLPIATVAALTGRTPNAVKALQHRALEALAQELGDGWSPLSAAGGNCRR
jgi:RNA polymerase sigma factor (sigma-70 family)